MPRNRKEITAALKRVGKGALANIGETINPNIAVKRQLSEIARERSDKQYREIIQNRRKREDRQSKQTKTEKQLEALFNKQDATNK